MGQDKSRSDVFQLSEKAALDVEFEVDSQTDLDRQKQLKPGRVGGVRAVLELAALVLVAQEMADDGDTCSDDLDRDVPLGADDLRVEREWRC